MNKQLRLPPSPGALLLLCGLLLTAATVVASSVTVAVGPATGASGSQVEIPIHIRGAKQLGYIQMELAYDPAVLEPATNSSGAGVLKGNLPQDVAVTSNVIASGHLRLGMNISDQNESVTGDGTLMKALFKVKGGSGKECALILENAEAWDNAQPNQRGLEMLVTVENGKFTVGRAWMMWLIILAAVLLLLLIVVWKKQRSTPQIVRQTPPEILTPPAPAVQQREIASHPAPSDSSCPQCHAAITRGANFCSECGTAIPAEPPSCPKCRAEVRTGVKFCDSCGQSLKPAGVA